MLGKKGRSSGLLQSFCSEFLEGMLLPFIEMQKLERGINGEGKYSSSVLDILHYRYLLDLVEVLNR